jgi:hypothetical protein
MSVSSLLLPPNPSLISLYSSLSRTPMDAEAEGRAGRADRPVALTDVGPPCSDGGGGSKGSWGPPLGGACPPEGDGEKGSRRRDAEEPDLRPRGGNDVEGARLPAAHGGSSTSGRRGGDNAGSRSTRELRAGGASPTAHPSVSIWGCSAPPSSAASPPVHGAGELRAGRGATQGSSGQSRRC